MSREEIDEAMGKPAATPPPVQTRPTLMETDPQLCPIPVQDAVFVTDPTTSLSSVTTNPQLTSVATCGAYQASIQSVMTNPQLGSVATVATDAQLYSRVVETYLPT